MSWLPRAYYEAKNCLMSFWSHFLFFVGTDPSTTSVVMLGLETYAFIKQHTIYRILGNVSSTTLPST